MSLMVTGERRSSIYAMHFSLIQTRCHPSYKVDSTREKQEYILIVKGLTEHPAAAVEAIYLLVYYYCSCSLKAASF